MNTGKNIKFAIIKITIVKLFHKFGSLSKAKPPIRKSKMWTESIQVYSIAGNASSSSSAAAAVAASSSPLSSFMEKLLVDSYFRSTHHPEYVICSDNAKLHYNDNVSRSQLLMIPSTPENHLLSSSFSLPLKFHQHHLRDYQVPSSSSRSYPSKKVPCTTSSIGNSRWDNNLANDDTNSPGCLGLIRPTRNASHDDLTTLSKKEKKKIGNTKNSISTPVVYKKMSIPRPKTGLKGRAQTV